MTKAEFSELFAFLRGAYPYQVVTQETAEAYWLMLRDSDVKPARIAVKRHVETSRFWPSIAELKKGIEEAAREMRPGLTREQLLSSIAAPQSNGPLLPSYRPKRLGELLASIKLLPKPDLDEAELEQRKRELAEQAKVLLNP